MTRFYCPLRKLKRLNIFKRKKSMFQNICRHEIQRFESVHPSIYAIYDLIELVPDPLLAQQIREHVVCIEGKIALNKVQNLSNHFELLLLFDKFLFLRLWGLKK